MDCVRSDVRAASVLVFSAPAITLSFTWLQSRLCASMTWVSPCHHCIMQLLLTSSYLVNCPAITRRTSLHDETVSAYPHVAVRTTTPISPCRVCSTERDVFFAFCLQKVRNPLTCGEQTPKRFANTGIFSRRFTVTVTSAATQQCSEDVAVLSPTCQNLMSTSGTMLETCLEVLMVSYVTIHDLPQLRS